MTLDEARRVFHAIQLYREVAMNREKVIAILDAIGDWSYAHRRGNGELTDEQQQELIDSAWHRVMAVIGE
jgi:hypothetical protein